MAIIRNADAKERPTIIRDTREKEGKGWYFRASANCDGMETTKLDVGDYTIKGLEDVIMSERKAIGDLWGTLGNPVNYKRFLKEMKRAENHPYKYLVIEGTLADINKGYYYSKVKPNNIHAKLISLQAKHNVHVVFAGRQNTARTWVRHFIIKMFDYYKQGYLNVPNTQTSN
jgi:ERCC4-type nuclease